MKLYLTLVLGLEAAIVQSNFVPTVSPAIEFTSGIINSKKFMV